jgi:hypothetical protein
MENHFVGGSDVVLVSAAVGQGKGRIRWVICVLTFVPLPRCVGEAGKAMSFAVRCGRALWWKPEGTATLPPGLLQSLPPNGSVSLHSSNMQLR